MRCSRTHHIYVSTPHRLCTLNMLCLSVCACCLPSIIFYCICGTAYLFIKCVQWIFHVSFSYFHFSFANAFFTVNSIFRLQLVVVLACYLYFFIYFFFYCLHRNSQPQCIQCAVLRDIPYVHCIQLYYRRLLLADHKTASQICRNAYMAMAMALWQWL